MIQYNNHPKLMAIVCLAEAYRKCEKSVERGVPEARISLDATRHMLDREISQWRKAIDENPSAFSKEST